MQRPLKAWKEAGKIFSFRWRTLVGFQVCYGLGATLIFTPLVHLCLGALVRSGGDSAITNFDLTSFFLSPTGMGFLAVGGLTGIISLRLQQATLFLLTAEAAGSPFLALKGAFQRIKSLLALTFIQVGALLVLALPLLVMVFLVWHVLLGQQDINYYTHAKPAVWYWALGLTGTFGLATVAVGVWVMARWVYTVPILLRSGKPAWTSLRASVQYTKGNWVKPLLTVGGFWLLLWGASNAVNWSVFGLGRWVILASGERLALSVFIVLGVFGTWGLISLATGTVGPIIHAILINRIFDTTFSLSPNHFPQETVKDRRLIRRIVLAVVLSALIAVSFGGAWWLKRLDFSDPVQITAHRGSSAAAPENTLSALRQAMKDGADFAEIDVQTTKDGEVVVLHDRDLMRMGRDPRALASLTLKELRKIDVGIPFGEAFRGERVPTLLEALELVRGRMGLNIELKYNLPDPTLAPRVVELLRKTGMLDRCVVTSLDYEALRQAKEIEPRLVTGMIVTKVLGDPTGLGVNFLSVNVAEAHRHLIWRARRKGLAIHAWTVNDAATFERMADRGVNVVITDRPAELSALRRDRSSLSAPQLIALRLRRLLL